MNGKIKTKFAALFAVALMITVCVVPVVGGSEDVEAAIPTTIDISGTVQNAAGQGWGGLEVTITSSASATSITVKTETNGSFNAEDVKVGDITASVVVTPNLSDETKNPAYGTSFPTITLTGVTVDQNIVIKAGTVAITGYLALKGTTNQGVYAKDISIRDSTGEIATTGKDGKFTFYGVPGVKYDLSAFFTTDFKGSITPSATGMNNVVLVAEGYLMKSQISAPFGMLVTTSDSTGTAAVSTSSVISTEIVDGEEKYYGYGLLTYANATSTVAVTAYWSYADATDSTKKYGFQDSGTVTLASANQTSGNFATSLPATGTVISGYVTVGDVKVTPTVVLKSTVSSTTDPAYNKNINAIIAADGKYFVGTTYDYAAGSIKTINNYKLVATVSSASGYIFNEPTDANTPITAQNEAKITIDAGKAGESFTIDGNGVVYSDQCNSTATKYVSGSDGKIIAYVPLGSGPFTFTAPTNYEPATEVITKVYSDLTLNFKYKSEVEYKGQLILNGIPVGKEVIETLTSVFDVTGMAWAVTDDGEEPYYTFKSTELPENISIKVSSGYPAQGSSGYTFVKDDSGNVAKVASPGVMTDIVIETSEQTQNIADAKGFGIKGVNVDFKMIDGSDYSEAKTIVDLGSATTDAQGDAKADFAVPLAGAGYSVVVIVSSNSEYGEYTFDDEGVFGYNSSKSIEASESTYYGYYTSNGSSLKGFGMSYVAKSGGKIVDFGAAKIVDNMYYIVAPASTTTPAVTVTLYVTLDKGFTTDVTNENAVTLTLSEAGRKDITAFALAEDNSVEVEILENEYFKFIEVNEPTTPVKGDVIVLSAEKSCYKTLNGFDQYKYTDAAIKYDFAGWYVNGKLLTEDCDTAITLSEDVVIVAQYEEAVKVIGSQDVPEAGLDTNVLILGIVVVVIALIAVVYSVISKRD